MLITLYTPIGIVYQNCEITENDITYGDLIKYINLPKHELYNELDKSKLWCIVLCKKELMKKWVNYYISIKLFFY